MKPNRTQVRQSAEAVKDFLRQVIYERSGGVSANPDPMDARNLLLCELVCLFIEHQMRVAWQSDDRSPVVSMAMAEETGRMMELLERAYMSHQECMGL